MKTKSVFKMPHELNRPIDEVDHMLAGGNLDLNLDFSECTFVSVEGLEWLEEVLLRASSLSSEIELTNIVPTIYKTFKVARIDSILKACGSPSPSGPVC